MNSADPATDPPRVSETNWPLWRIILAYAILLAIAFMSIWVIDRRVDALAEPSPGPQTRR